MPVPLCSQNWGSSKAAHERAVMLVVQVPEAPAILTGLFVLFFPF